MVIYVQFLCLIFKQLPVFQNNCTIFTFPSAIYEGSNFSTSLLSVFFILANLVGVK